MNSEKRGSRAINYKINKASQFQYHEKSYRDQTVDNDQRGTFLNEVLNVKEFQSKRVSSCLWITDT